MQSIVILGTGLAGYTLARELRKLDTTTPLHLITRDDGSFYSKPVLSNALAQKKTPEQIALNGAADMERQLAATLSPHSFLSAIDTAAQRVTIGDQTVAYAKLVLAIGADPIRLPLAGNAAADVLSVNDLNDYRQFRKSLDGKTKVALLGAGLIGCEFANDLRGAGFGVDVIDLAPQPLGRLLPTQAARFLRAALEGTGVRFHFETTAQSVTRTDTRLTIALANGARIETGLVLSAVGLRPRIELARSAGLSVNRGIVTDTLLQTSAADVYALGDCAEVAGLNLPFVMPIMQQARALAKTLSGTPTAVHYPAMPVVVKTPTCPSVVCPPPPGVEGKWEESVAADGVRALFHDTSGKLRGFALVGAATKDKQALTKDIPPLLG
jgi:rubredoxin-NAD+ reductase